MAQSATLKLKDIELAPISKGGYIIGYEGTMPAGATLWLGVPDLSNAMEVSGKDPNDLLNPTNLPVFLSLIGKRKAWGAQASCKVFAKLGNSVIVESGAQLFACPVRPYVGLLSPSLGRGDEGPPLTYTGTPPNYPDGRFLYMPAIDRCYYFAYAGKFETNNLKRGFNCITYVGAAFGVDVKSKAMSAYGTQLAQYCGCTPSDCENKSLKEVKEFFKRKPLGTYFMWSEHHIVIVVNAVVHEFREKLGRYNTQPIAAWQHNDEQWWVRKAHKQF
jgi:hypothetical protein